MLKTWRWIAPLAVAGGLIAASGAVPAEAASATTYGISIHAKNPNIPNVSHDTFVVYGDRGYQNATVSGTVTGATAGDVVTLLAKPFKAKNFAPTGKPVTLASATQNYSFSVRPTLATAYEARVTTGSTVDATSPAQFVYVALVQTVNKNSYHYSKCTRTACTLNITTRTNVPASAYRTESRKRWYLYLGLNRSGTTPPKYLSLDRNASASKAKRLSATAYQIVFSFPRIPRNGEYPWPNACTKDAESHDGIGLPGHHDCGYKKIRSNAIYLG
jgi:hypothetical protein